MRIDSIRIDSLLPSVFSSEEIPRSDVWKTDFTFRRGERYLIEAESGGGKSSLAAFLIGSRNDYEGTILFDETDIRDIPVSGWQEIRRRNLAYLPQELSLFPELTALENILLKAELSGQPDIAKIESWMKRLGIWFRKDYPAGRLSIGQQQRTALIRSLCQPFDFILLDEPVSHLDESNNRIAADIVMEEAELQGAGIMTFSVGNPLLITDFTKLSL